MSRKRTTVIEKIVVSADDMQADLEKLARKAQIAYDKGCQESDLYALSHQATQCGRTLIELRDKDADLSTIYTRAQKLPEVKLINELARKRAVENKVVTVGDLIKRLQKLDPNLPVKVGVWVSCITDAGTDMGGTEEKDISSVDDLESRVVLGT